MTTRLLEQLKAGTRTLHTEVERTPFMASMIRGDIALPAYAAWLVNLQAIYTALESRIDAARHDAVLAPAAIAGLARRAALTADLHHLERGGTAPSNALQPATVGYVQRLASADAPRLLAHAYVRYLGDLSGGQILRRILGRIGAPTAFYEFAPDDAQTLAGRFRLAMDAAPLDDEQIGTVVDEAGSAFARHIALCHELENAGKP